MKNYLVLRPEKHYSHVEVAAENEAQAIELVKQGEGEEIYLEYSNTLDNGWSAEEKQS